MSQQDDIARYERALRDIIKLREHPFGFYLAQKIATQAIFLEPTQESIVPKNAESQP